MIDLKTPLAYELADLFYKRLQENGELNVNDIFEISDLKNEYRLRRVNAGAIKILEEREDVVRLKRENGTKSFNFKLLS